MTHPAQTKLFEEIKTVMNLNSDAAVGRALDYPPTVISKLRHGKIATGPGTILRIHEKTGIPVKRIREVIAT